MIPDKFDKRVVGKMSSVISSFPELSDKYLRKWGIPISQLERHLLDYGFHGGAWSKQMSLQHLDIKQGIKVLDIGPETGIEMCMLGELGADLGVIEPDGDNLHLLRMIATRYVTEAGSVLADHVDFYKSGFPMDTAKLQAEKRNYTAVLSLRQKGFPTYYNISEMNEISLLPGDIDCIFIHKIITTLSRFTGREPYKVLIENSKLVWPLLKTGGVMSWTEPAVLLSHLPSKEGLPGNTRKISYRLPIVNEEYVQLIISK